MKGTFQVHFICMIKEAWKGLQTTGFTVTRSTGKSFKANNGAYLSFIMYRKKRKW